MCMRRFVFATNLILNYNIHFVKKIHFMDLLMPIY